MNEPTHGEVEGFLRAFLELHRIAVDAHGLGGSGELAERVLGHLGVEADDLAVVGHEIAAVERPNVQLAVESLVELTEVIGLNPDSANFPGFSVLALLSGGFRGPTEPVAVSYDDVPTDVGVTMRCVRAGIWLGAVGDEVVAIALHPTAQRGPFDSKYRVDVFAADEAGASAVRDRLTDESSRRNVYRSKVLGFTFSEHGEFGISFLERPTTSASEVILADGALESIRRHTVDMAAHADALRDAGQHLKRGLLLYGPPGTGKTHTAGHLMAAMTDRTVVVLQGMSVGALGQAAAIVRSLPPAMLIIEDVDLIAMERGFDPRGGQMLFQLLNEMDGLGPDDDVIFVLTTNRLEMLEPALAARPGRIDHAVEIGLPDRNARRQLLDLYLADQPGDRSRLDSLAERLEGVTGAFIKELVRRAVATMVIDGASDITASHLDAAATEMLQAAGPIHAAMLGGPGQPGQPGPPGQPGFPPGGMHGIAPPWA